jgi:hypothetical protein
MHIFSFKMSLPYINQTVALLVASIIFVSFKPKIRFSENLINNKVNARVTVWAIKLALI